MNLAFSDPEFHKELFRNDVQIGKELEPENGLAEEFDDDSSLTVNEVFETAYQGATCAEATLVEDGTVVASGPVEEGSTEDHDMVMSESDSESDEEEFSDAGEKLDDDNDPEWTTGKVKVKGRAKGEHEKENGTSPATFEAPPAPAQRQRRATKPNARYLDKNWLRC